MIQSEKLVGFNQESEMEHGVHETTMNHISVKFKKKKKNFCSFWFLFGFNYQSLEGNTDHLSNPVRLPHDELLTVYLTLSSVNE